MTKSSAALWIWTSSILKRTMEPFFSLRDGIIHLPSVKKQKMSW